LPVGVDGFFFETHYNPDEALSDGPNMITPDMLDSILKDIECINKCKEN
jgi:2-dehydro-3-deoxyphosphooctonate aldolase (KDO 8-P synthase)